MESFWFVCLFVCVFLLPFLGETEGADEAEKNGVYIVYMGAAGSSNGSLRHDHNQLLISILRRKKSALVHNYKHGFSGFAARLSKEEALSIARKSGVVSVFADPILQLHTTRSWDFLHDSDHLDNKIISASNSQLHSSTGSDTIIGILDTGIWPEAESFSDAHMGTIPPRWKGTCMEGANFNSSNCNKKLIGARYYKDPDMESTEHDSPRDGMGHGTHVSSTAAGSPTSASYYGLAAGVARGGSPLSRIAMYKVCNAGGGCRGSAILAAFDDAIMDGVDLLSLSLGAPNPEKTDFTSDPIAIGALHAVENGITVVCSAGNSGPRHRSVSNDAPWILTVAASTLDRDFESDVVLGGNKVIKGHAINFAGLETRPVYPLIDGKSAKKNSSKDDDARKCSPDSLDGVKVIGKIVFCDEDKDNDYSPPAKLSEVKSRGGIGLVLVDDLEIAFPQNYGLFPMTAISSKDAADIYSYINSTRNPVATIRATETQIKYKPAPVMIYFSSRGPSPSTRNLLKPDIAAPGVNILAAWMGNDTSEAVEGRDPPLFNLISGTSMACPHVSGIVAGIKSVNPTWSPSAVRSAIITTAIQTDNFKAPITSDLDGVATPYHYGAGEVSLSRPLHPGLVYEIGTVDYLHFLCYYGYDESKIKLISPTLPEGFSCPQNSTTDFISEINYPSIAVSKFDGKQSRTVTRTATNVGDEEETTYTVSVEATGDLKVEVSPNILLFTKDAKRQTFQVVFSSANSSEFRGDYFGSITWTNGKYKVRSPFVVSSGNDDDLVDMQS